MILSRAGWFGSGPEAGSSDCEIEDYNDPLSLLLLIGNICTFVSSCLLHIVGQILVCFSMKNVRYGQIFAKSWSDFGQIFVVLVVRFWSDF